MECSAGQKMYPNAGILDPALQNRPEQHEQTAGHNHNHRKR